VNVPRRLENDRWLFGVTLALCLFGAVMIFSASAVTAEQQYGTRTYFSSARLHGYSSALGMFALMKTDYRRLREPQSSIRSLRRLALARRHVFPRQVPCHASLDQVRPGGAFSRRTGETSHDSLSGVVSRSEAPQEGRNGIPQGRFLADYFSSGWSHSGLRRIDFAAT